MLDRIEELEKRYQELTDALSDPQTAQNPAKFQTIAKEAGDLREVVEKGGQYRKVVMEL